MNRNERRDMTVAELREVQDELVARTEEHAEGLARQGFQIPPMARYEILIQTIADMAFGENTRRRIEFEIAVQERWMQLFDPANVERMKHDALEAAARARLTEGVAGMPTEMPGADAARVIQLP